MKMRILLVSLFFGLMASASAAQAEKQAEEKTGAAKKATEPAYDFKALFEKIVTAWETLDPAKAAPFYAKEPGRAFYDFTPLKYTGWAEYAAGVTKVLADYASLKFTLGEDLQTHQHGNLAWATTTWHGDAVMKDGSKAALDGRWTLLWEKRGNNWLIVHEHFSVPASPPETKK